MSKTFNLFNEFHLGDCIFVIHYLNQYIEEGYKFNFYVGHEHMDELHKHIKNKNITLYHLSERPNDSYNMWIGHNDFWYNYHNHQWENTSHLYDVFYVDFFKMTSNNLGIENKIETIYDMLFDNSNHKISLPKNFDYLIINSIPRSNQFDYNHQDFVDLCDFFYEKNITFITTNKVNNYECTLDYGMSIVDIGNLSNQCKNIIGINTAPLITTFTKQNIETVNKRFILDKGLTFSYNDRIHQIRNVNEIYQYIT